MRTRYIDQDIVSLIRDSMSPDEWLALWVAAETGLRISDILSLKHSALFSGQLRYVAHKTGKKGSALLSQALWRSLSAHSAQNSHLSPWLFPSPRDRNKHLSRQAVWYRLKRACKRASVDPAGIAPHSFRKFFAVELFKREGLAVTQRALQHDRASTTELYALSDFTSGASALQPLLRRDLPMIVQEVLRALSGRLPDTGFHR